VPHLSFACSSASDFDAAAKASISLSATPKQLHSVRPRAAERAASPTSTLPRSKTPPSHFSI
jgi:hypothetical protein